jgi:hypothetical protein
MSDSNIKPPATENKPAEAGPSGTKEDAKKKLPQLGALEDDDEFEVGLP